MATRSSSLMVTNKGQDKRSYSALAPNSPNSTLIHKLSTGQALNDRGARQSNSLKLQVKLQWLRQFFCSSPGSRWRQREMLEF